MSNYVPLTKGIGRSAQNIRGSFSNFRDNKFVSGSKEFLNSNSLVAKITFLLLVVIVFVLLLRLGTSIVTWAMSPKRSPKLVTGILNGRRSKVITQDPKDKNSITVLRSRNETDGIEFTWSVWLFIENLTDDGKYKHIFHKGNDAIQTSGDRNGMNYPNNGPGLYLGKDPNNMNSLVIAMNTFDPSITDASTDMNEIVIVNDIPLNKWFNVMIRVDGRNLDTYINGTIINRHVLRGVAKQNYGNVYVNMNGGFEGLLSDLWYHDHGLNISEIQTIVNNGPDMTMSKSMEVFPPYLSLGWYFNQ